MPRTAPRSGGAADASRSTSSSGRTWPSRTTTASPSRPATSARRGVELELAAEPGQRLRRRLRLRLHRLRADAVLRAGLAGARAAVLPGLRPLRQHPGLRARAPGEPVGLASASEAASGSAAARATSRSQFIAEDNVASSSTTTCCSTPRSGIRLGDWRLDPQPQEPDGRGVRDPGLRLDLGDPRRAVRGLAAGRLPDVGCASVANHRE